MHYVNRQITRCSLKGTFNVDVTLMEMFILPSITELVVSFFIIFKGSGCSVTLHAPSLMTFGISIK